MLSFAPLLRVHGREHLVGLEEPAIFALNHGGTLESVLVPAALVYLRSGRPVHFLCDWMYLHLPVAGWILRQGEPIAVYGKRARFGWGEEIRRAERKPPVERCLERLEAGGSVGLFPEGARNRDPRTLLRGRAGLGELVLRSAEDAGAPDGGEPRLRWSGKAALGRPALS